MAEPKKKDSVDLDDILEQAGAEEPIDLTEYSTDGLAEDGAEFVDDIASSDDELEALRAERDDYRDRFMRALADSENVRKRSERDRREAEQYGGTKLARDMLPVFDNLNRALDAAREDNGDTKSAVVEGVELTLRELLNIFTKHGIQPIVPEAGDKFDPQLHQAMFEAPVPDTKAGDIIQVMTHGFMLHDRLLRPAQVGVSSTPAS
ncbi:nucleotide exchange factor GrpE [Qingshengfaniella alkalisoli]|uniref:Protein GrpE n=1 Tax=Qingshengfaniella alkalisoli TaxID=2599296 RepID=A0A5B8IA22_9RHOB|nr:nucleotide exchange factor GrpE [Qingshengfaniella alkalisoli]QDY69996.1 nucleotide exchange factor GrpE [Qingshengfaniella alkalisoli]